MAKLEIVAGATSQSVNIYIQDSSSSTGAGLTGFAPAGGSVLTGLHCYYSFGGTNAGSVQQALSAPAAVNSAFSAGQIVEIDATNMPGVARLDLPNAALASGKGQFVTFILQGGTHVAPCVLEIELVAYNNQALLTTNVTQISGSNVSTATAQIGVNLVNIAGSAVATGTAQLGVNVVNIAGTASAGAAGYAGVDWGNVHAPTTTLDLSGTTIKNTDNGVTVSTNNDKTGYSLSQSFPSNFSSLAITAGGATTVGTNNDKTGYSLSAGQLFIKKNTGITITFPMTDSTTHAPKTGIGTGVTCQRSIDGNAVASCANANTELSGGLYSLVLAAADTNGTMITYIFSAAGADTRFIGVVTQA